MNRPGVISLRRIIYSAGLKFVGIVDILVTAGDLEAAGLEVVKVCHMER